MSTTTTQKSIGLQRIYLKDLSFESPSTPDIFRNQWSPKIELNMQTIVQSLADNLHEITLKVLIKAQHEQTTIFLIECHQAGIFEIVGFDNQELQQIQHSYCPSTLFPYARETVSDLVMRGTFPQLLLAPVNFDTLWLESQNNLASKVSEDENKDAS